MRNLLKKIARAFSGGAEIPTPFTVDAREKVEGRVNIETPGRSNEQAFKRDAFWSNAEIEAFDQAASAVGLRLFPKPFNAIAAVFSDCDFSDAGTTVRNWWNVCFKRNLDWGESFQLINNKERFELAAPILPKSRHPYLLAQTHEEASRLLALGLLDHFHGISTGYPAAIEIATDRLDARNGAFFIADPVDLLRLIGKEEAAEITSMAIASVYVELDEGDAPPRVCLKLRNGPELPCSPAGSQSKREGGNAYELAINFPADLKTCVRLPELERIIVNTEKRPRRIMLQSVGREALRQQLEGLNQHCEKLPPLLTDHSATGFLNTSSFNNNNQARTYRPKSENPPLKFQLYADRDGESFLPDEPGTPLYIGKQMDSFGIYFVNPSGISGESLNQIHPLQSLSRTHRRDGGPVYVVRRILPQKDETYIDKKLTQFIARKSRITTFAARLSTAVQCLRATDEAKAFPIYTHLGANQSWEHRQDLFDDPPVGWLQDHVFNFSQTVPDAQRLYLVRASVYCEYLRVLSQVPNHTRRQGDEIRVSSWDDEHIGVATPGSPALLHGITFKCTNSLHGEVMLDGERIKDLLRIGSHVGADEECVTVLSGGVTQRIKANGKRERNCIGNVYYIGLECGSGADLPDAPWGVIISGDDAFRLYIGPKTAQPSDIPLTGHISVEDWQVFDDETVWFSLANAAWTTGLPSHVSCFGRTFSAEIVSAGNAAPPRPSGSVLFMKPGNAAGPAIEADNWESFLYWFHLMKENGMGLRRRHAAP